LSQLYSAHLLSKCLVNCDTCEDLVMAGVGTQAIADTALPTVGIVEAQAQREPALIGIPT